MSDISIERSIKAHYKLGKILTLHQLGQNAFDFEVSKNATFQNLVAPEVQGQGKKPRYI